MRAGFSAVCPHPDPLPKGEGEKQYALFDGRISNNDSNRGDPGPAIGASIVRRHLIRKTIQPSFTRLGRANDGVAGNVGMFPGMPIRRGVATEGRATSLAETQVNPRIAGFHALLTFGVLREFEMVNALDMFTKIVAGHLFLLTPIALHVVRLPCRL